MWDLQQKVCLCDHDEETPRHPHRGEALGVRGMWKEVHTEGKPEGKSVELIKTGKYVQCIFSRFMREHTGM